MASVLRFAPALLLSALSFGCATTGSSGGADTAESEEAAPAPAEAVDEEVPDVAVCHTESTTCELPEPLQPGLGCFCTLEDGTKEAGSAGG